MTILVRHSRNSCLKTRYIKQTNHSQSLWPLEVVFFCREAAKREIGSPLAGKNGRQHSNDRGVGHCKEGQKQEILQRWFCVVSGDVLFLTLPK